MKNKDINLLIEILILLIIIGFVILIIYFIYPGQNQGQPNSNNPCKYDSTTKDYIKKDPNCIINFLCIEGKRAFSDSCGCGCETISIINSSDTKHYCTEQEKKAQVCPEYYTDTCGWFNSNIRCIKYPCAKSYSNPCFSCADPDVEYYTQGLCPK